MTDAEPALRPTYVFYGPTPILIGDHSVQNNFITVASTDPLETEVKQLGRVVLAQWQQEAELRGLHLSRPIPIRWSASPGGEFDDHPELTGGSVQGSTADLTSFAETFLNLSRGRLVVLGGPGSGKTTLAVLLVIDLLQRMREESPVPVLLSIASWRPRAEHLATWLERQLLREYPYLSLETIRLLRQGRRILPVLDGLDELPATERPLALDKLNSLEDKTSLILICRTQDYAEAISSTEVLRAAAVVEAEPLTAEAASRYLFKSAAPQKQDRWRPLTDALIEDPSCPAAEALKVPLMLWLCRTVYRSPAPGERPEDLIDRCRFPTPEAVERHLLDSLVPSVYSRDPLPPPQLGRKASDAWSEKERNRDTERVSRWLGFLARHLERHDRTDLAWWELGSGMRLVPRMLLTGLLAGACVALLIGPMDGLAAAFYDPEPGPARDLATRLVDGLTIMGLDGLINGVPVALVTALVHGIGVVFRGAALEPTRMRIRLVGRRGRAGARSGSEILARAGIGLVAGVAGGAGVGLLQGFGRALFLEDPAWSEVGPGDAVLYAVLFALPAGLVGALMAWSEVPVAIASAPEPRDLLALNRRTLLLQWLVFAPLFGCLVGFGGEAMIIALHNSLWGIELIWGVAGGFRFGMLAPLVVGLATTLSLSAWGQWTVFARVWLPLTGRLPLAAMTFLEDAHGRGVLRKVGAVYQFRHARLQQHFAVEGGAGAPASPTVEQRAGEQP
ncbi:NACHT domain-containing protein [Kitasatospora brasiliensis]|uniref:NACHT domain-containing protein n=1 Tax=Kitasatospora brasiliensis TaxID=3058040 RepID=UPI00292F1572|nr:NACHT domain-containing protein [Kitasatospora sp. K002]